MLSLKTKAKVKSKKIIFVGILKATANDPDPYGPKDPNPDPQQIVTDPEHWLGLRTYALGTVNKEWSTVTGEDWGLSSKNRNLSTDLEFFL
jgi:hypothetical protein